jgi:type II secretory pathway pseudopilin PulG
MRHGEATSRLRPARHTAQHRQAGFAWLFVLFLLAAASAAGAAVAQRWADQSSREKERQLLRIGDAYAQALAAYRASSPGSDKRFPQSLEQLVDDHRFVGTRRHLRKLYADPVTGQADWVLLRDARGDIAGLHSKSDKQPWARVAMKLEFTDLGAAERYADWIFTPRLPPP